MTSHRIRLVAQGFSQKEGVDYHFDDMFAPVARIESSHVLCALAASNDWEIGQIDVKSVYLYGRMEEGEVIYMRPPAGVKLKSLAEGEYLRLLVCIYGLKQASRRWYMKCHDIMKKISLTRSNLDHAVYL